MSDSILQRLQAQRDMLRGLLEQIDIAVSLFGGASPNGHNETIRRADRVYARARPNGQNWASRKSPEQMAVIVRKRAKTRRRNERAARRAAFKADAEAAARAREGVWIPQP